jgi:hypothetical protein
MLQFVDPHSKTVQWLGDGRRQIPGLKLANRVSDLPAVAFRQALQKIAHVIKAVEGAHQYQPS